MKKFVAMLLAVCMSLSLVACGDSGTVADETSSTAVSSKDESRVETSSEAESNDDSSSETESDEDDSDNESSAASSEEESDNTSSAEEELSEEYMDTAPTIEETVLWDEQNVKVTALSLTYTDDRVELLLRFENNSDKTLEFYEDEDIINGYRITSGVIRDTVEAGETAEDSKRYLISDLHECGITQVADITFSMIVYIENQTEHYADLAFQSIQTSAAQSYDYDTDTFEQALTEETYETLTSYEVEQIFTDEIFNSCDVIIPTVVLATDWLGQQLLLIEINNQSAERLWIDLLDLYINDTYISGGNCLTSASGTRAITDIDISRFMKAADETIDEDAHKVTFTIKIYSYNEKGNIDELLCEAQQITFEF